MKSAQMMILACSVAILGAACGSARKKADRLPPATEGLRVPKDHLPSLESHMAAAWIDGATRLQGASAAVIYYRGAARRTSAEGEPWMGSVEGDILFVSPEKALLVSKGTLTLGPDNAIKVVGPHRSFLATPGKDPEWRALLPI